MSVTSKIKQVWHYVPKRVAAVTVLTAGVIAAVTIPVASNAWGPTRDTFTIEKPADHIAFDSITNNPNYGDERNFLRVRDSDSKYWVAGSNPTGYGNSGKNGWTDTMNMREGHTYDVKLYVHNNAAANLNLVATNVRAHINLPTKESTFGHQFEINGYLWADNAKPQEIWDNIVLKGDEAFHVKVVSQKYYNNLKTEDKGGFDLPNEVYTAKGAGTGALLGYDQMDGKIPGCFQYSGFVLLKIQPVFQVKPAPSYDVAKTVDKTTANPGDTINYTITVKNTGNINLTNVKVNDQLPAYYSSAKETVTSKNGSTGSIVKGGSITFKQLDVGETATIKISYTIKNKDQLECGTTTIINKVTSSTDQDNTEDNNDNNQTTTTVNRECQPSYDVIKTVDKTTANPGDTIKYTITAKNTGNVDLTNVKVTDKLPAVYKKASEKVTAPSAITGSIVKNGEVTIAKLPVGKSATIDITYVIKDAKNLPCGTTTIKNHAEGVTDQDNTEDRTDNNDTTTTVDQICTTSFDLVKTVDKTTAKPGDTLTYTLTFKNTGEKALAGVVIRDVLPDKVTLVKDSLKVEPADTEYTGDLEQGIKIKQVAANDVVSVSFQVIVAEEGKFECGITKITNTGSATTDELDKENGNTEDNKVTTEVNKVCTPVTPPVTPPTTPPATTTDDKAVPESPKVIAQTGAGQAIGSVIAIASLIAAITAYIRSRRYAQGL